MDSTHTTSLDILELREDALVAHFFLAIENNSLLSVRQLYNEGYYVTFKVDGITIFNHGGKSILIGHIDLGT
jgi:hypothetical protein